ncbi:MAG: 50S ribosomal protein L32e [Candidatus Methanomethylicaceae archaeon]
MSDPKELSRALKIREKISQKRPDFIRQEANRFPRLGEKWRSCTGIRSKMRLKKKGRAAIVEPGYRGPTMARGLHPSGKREVLVYNVEDLEKVNPSTDVIRIASSVGKRKRLEIIKKSKTIGVSVVNIRPSEKAILEKTEVQEESKKESGKEKEKEEEEKVEELTGEQKEESEEKELGTEAEEEWSAEKEEREVEGSG